MKYRKYFKDQAYANHIRIMPCAICKEGDWDEQYGCWSNTPAHIKSKGMGGANKQEHGNLIPLCIYCHHIFDTQWNKDQKEPMRLLALDIYQNYKS